MHPHLGQELADQPGGCAEICLYGLPERFLGREAAIAPGVGSLLRPIANLSFGNVGLSEWPKRDHITGPCGRRFRFSHILRGSHLCSDPLSGHRVELPFALDALQGVRTAVIKVELGPNDQVTHRARHQYFAGPGLVHDA